MKEPELTLERVGQVLRLDDDSLASIKGIIPDMLCKLKKHSILAPWSDRRLRNTCLLFASRVTLWLCNPVAPGESAVIINVTSSSVSAEEGGNRKRDAEKIGEGDEETVSTTLPSHSSTVSESFKLKKWRRRVQTRICRWNLVQEQDNANKGEAESGHCEAQTATKPPLEILMPTVGSDSDACLSEHFESASTVRMAWLCRWSMYFTYRLTV